MLPFPARTPGVRHAAVARTVGGPLDSTPGRTGLWLVGARGSVAATTALGALAVAAGVAPATGLVTELPEFAGQGLPRWEDLVIGGHDVVPTPLPKKAEAL